MISPGSFLIACDGADSAPQRTCRASQAVSIPLGLDLDEALFFIATDLAGWLVRPERARCPICLTLDHAAAESRHRRQDGLKA